MTENDRTRHDLFVQRVRETRNVWGLKSDKGWAVCESSEYEDAVVYPFWSDEADARLHCTDDWSRYAPTSIELDIFLHTWLPGMAEDNALVGTNWDQKLSGVELEPIDLARQLDDED